MPRASQAARSILSRPTPYLAMARRRGAAASTVASTGSTPTIRPSQSASFSHIRSAERMPPVSLRTTSSPASRRMSKSSGLFLPKDRGVARTFMTGLLVGKGVRRGRRSLPAGCPAEKGRAGRGRAVHALLDALCGPSRFCAGGRGLRPEPSPAGGFVNVGRGRGQVPVFLCLAGVCRVQCAKKMQRR